MTFKGLPSIPFGACLKPCCGPCLRIPRGIVVRWLSIIVLVRGILGAWYAFLSDLGNSIYFPQLQGLAIFVYAGLDLLLGIVGILVCLALEKHSRFFTNVTTRMVQLLTLFVLLSAFVNIILQSIQRNYYLSLCQQNTGGAMGIPGAGTEAWCEVEWDLGMMASVMAWLFNTGINITLTNAADTLRKLLIEESVLPLTSTTPSTGSSSPTEVVNGPPTVSQDPPPLPAATGVLGPIQEEPPAPEPTEEVGRTSTFSLPPYTAFPSVSASAAASGLSVTHATPPATSYSQPPVTSRADAVDPSPQLSSAAFSTPLQYQYPFSHSPPSQHIPHLFQHASPRSGSRSRQRTLSRTPRLARHSLPQVITIPNAPLGPRMNTSPRFSTPNPLLSTTSPPPFTLDSPRDTPPHRHHHHRRQRSNSLDPFVMTSPHDHRRLLQRYYPGSPTQADTRVVSFALPPAYTSPTPES